MKCQIKIILAAGMFLLVSGIISCKKYLDKKPDQSMVIPRTVKDLQAVLDNTNVFNAGYPYAIDLGVDDY